MALYLLPKLFLSRLSSSTRSIDSLYAFLLKLIKRKKGDAKALTRAYLDPDVNLLKYVELDLISNIVSCTNFIVYAKT